MMQSERDASCRKAFIELLRLVESHSQGRGRADAERRQPWEPSRLPARQMPIKMMSVHVSAHTEIIW